MNNVRRISRQLFAYGTADVLVMAVGFLLLPIYTRVLTPRDLGALALLLVVEGVLKVVNRWGLDAAFLRFYYDYPTTEDRKRLAGTIAAFIAAANGAIALLLFAASIPVSRLLFGSLEYLTAFQLLLLNQFAGAFLFLPLNLLRIQERSRLFAGLNFLRSFGTLLLRLVLVLGLRYGITGVMLADVIVTGALLVILARTGKDMLAWRFSPAMIRPLLRFGLPHVPHGLLSQITSMADRFVLGMVMPLDTVGLYQIGSTIAGVIKFYPVAFEAAWMPFAYDSLQRRDAPALFARMGTYAFAVLILATVAIAGLASPVMALALPPSYGPVAPLVPLLVVGMAVQSLTWFLMTSLNVAKQTSKFPLITAVGAVASLGCNLLLIPPLGMLGAATALFVSQAITTAVTAYYSQRAYHIPYEGSRLARVLGVGALTYGAMVVTTPASLWESIAIRGVLLLIFPVGLFVLRFFEPHEIAELRKVVATLRRQPAADSVV